MLSLDGPIEFPSKPASAGVAADRLVEALSSCRLTAISQPPLTERPWRVCGCYQRAADSQPDLLQSIFVEPASALPLFPSQESAGEVRVTAPWAVAPAGANYAGPGRSTGWCRFCSSHLNMQIENDLPKSRILCAFGTTTMRRFQHLMGHQFPTHTVRLGNSGLGRDSHFVARLRESFPAEPARYAAVADPQSHALNDPGT